MPLRLPKHDHPRLRFEAQARDAGVEGARERARELGANAVLGRSWTCPECGVSILAAHITSGFTYVGRHLRAACGCIAATAKAAEDAWREEHRWELAADLLSYCDIPSRYERKSFDDFKLRKGAAKPLRACRQYAETFVPGVGEKHTATGLYIVGTVGAGKTHLAVATAAEIAGRVLTHTPFITSAGLVQQVRGDGQRFQWSLIEDAIAAELLVLDDLGQEQATEFSRDVVYRVINGRYEEARPTIITTNLGDTEVRDQYGPALISRLYEMCQLVKVEASDYRAEQARKGAA